MNYNNLGIMKMMQVRMHYLAERQDVIAHNIANMDTPGYKPHDLPKLNFDRAVKGAMSKLKIRATSDSHITQPPRNDPDFRAEEQEKFYETTPVENSVVLEEQMAKMSENNIDYQTTIAMYRKTTAMFMTALGKGGS